MPEDDAARPGHGKRLLTVAFDVGFGMRAINKNEVELLGELVGLQRFTINEKLFDFFFRRACPYKRKLKKQILQEHLIDLTFRPLPVICIL